MLHVVIIWIALRYSTIGIESLDVFLSLAVKYIKLTINASHVCSYDNVFSVVLYVLVVL